MIYLHNRFTRDVLWTYNTLAERDAELKLALYAARMSPDHADLRLVDLSGDNLAGFDLRGLDLSCADLSSADLTGANLADVCLAGAKIQSANLTGANLAGAQLSGADLSGSDLHGANIARADLTDTNLANVRLAGVKLSTANLARIKEDFRVSIDLGPRECVALLGELRTGRTEHPVTRSRPITSKFFRATQEIATEDRPCTIAVSWLTDWMKERFMVASVGIDDMAQIVAALR
jgi:Pentapeptide repeats (8 copies)